MTVFSNTTGERGFTLIEMLVALSVFSLAALALVRLQGFTTRNAAELELRVVAQSVVRNRAVEILTDPRPPSLGESSGEEENGGLGWTWTQSARLTEEGNFIQVDITAQEKINGAPATLTILRPANIVLDALQPVSPAEN
ncbi:type II secretion system minor pseudopilin GspI [Sphingorhabdus sp. EL138]|uniref:type II secretion system minor pseudopilin GspI n=1 Tax=Sphingorhabdus sp. EL138 TaxID=2073156 RepID=UPI000D69B221|nr:type II secretion system minor pseudopilin GspI [Sphingorhabdus sp. EL138]